MGKTTGPIWGKLVSDLDQAGDHRGGSGKGELGGKLSGLDLRLWPGLRSQWLSGHSCREDSLDMVELK